ncbi:hypothetical protein Enr13x_23250 [Stieleria neptunia]|uniref:Uncharacterized protein n=1 Tax=Stieleria neptunia TaxID=2527979 RepID=A0A518HNQ7_9BACT|nr:hypothetical protein [Stieleria neptunia]QDV42478.1 hypothetical protein Enr13x_23250 [Stieleria neptunia]
MSESSTHPWSDSWPENVRTASKTLGFSSIIALLRSMEAVPYATVAEKIGGIPPIQIIALAFEEAKRSDSLEWVIRDCLCRNIVEKCRAGWDCGDNSRSNRTRAVGAWVTEVSRTGQNPELRERLLSMAKQLLESDVDASWIPKSNSDPVLEKLFEQLELG